MPFFKYISLFFFSCLTLSFNNISAKGTNLYEVKLQGKSVKSKESVFDNSIINYDFHSYFRLYKNGEIDTLFNQILDSFFLYSALTYELQQVPKAEIDAWRNYKVERIKKVYSSLIAKNNADTIVDILVSIPFADGCENVNKLNAEYWGIDSCAYSIENDVLLLTVYSNDNSGLLRYPAKQLIVDLKSHKRVENLRVMIKTKYWKDFYEALNKQLTIQLYKMSNSFNDNNITFLITHISLEQILNNSIINGNNECLELYIVSCRQTDDKPSGEVFLERPFERNLKFGDQYKSTSNFNFQLAKVCISFRDLRLQSSIINKKYRPILVAK